MAGGRGYEEKWIAQSCALYRWSQLVFVFEQMWEVNEKEKKRYGYWCYSLTMG